MVMSAPVDYQGVALVITASGTFLTAAIAGYIAVRQAAIHRLVNGMSHELQDADKKAAGAEGFIAGSSGDKYQPPTVREPAP
jgi:hypothetical protein